MLSLSFSIPVLVTDSPALNDLRNALGSEWLLTFTGAITADKIQKAMAHFGNFPAARVAPLDEFDWSAIAMHTVEFFSRVSSQQELAGA